MDDFTAQEGENQSMRVGQLAPKASYTLAFSDRVLAHRPMYALHSIQTGSPTLYSKVPNQPIPYPKPSLPFLNHFIPTHQ